MLTLHSLPEREQHSTRHTDLSPQTRESAPARCATCREWTRRCLDIPVPAEGGQSGGHPRARAHWHRYRLGLKVAREKDRFVPPQLQHLPARLVVENFVQAASQLPVLVSVLPFKP